MPSRYFSRVLVGSACATLVLAAAVSTPLAASDDGDVKCNGTAPPVVPHDLIVPANSSCTILFGSRVGHDVKVFEGATLDDRGAYIGHDVKADRPMGIAVNGGGMQGSGTVGHDVHIKGVFGDGLPSGRNSVCNNHIGHDVVIEDSAMTAAMWSIGDIHGVCGGGPNTVDHDIKINHNHNLIRVKDNTPAQGGDIGHDLTMTDNDGGLTASDNHAGHDCKQKNNHPYSFIDGPPGGPNTADHSVDNCNTVNP